MRVISKAKWITEILDAMESGPGPVVVQIDNDCLGAFRPDVDDYTEVNAIEIPGPRQALGDLLSALGIESCSA